MKSAGVDFWESGQLFQIKGARLSFLTSFVQSVIIWVLLSFTICVVCRLKVFT